MSRISKPSFVYVTYITTTPQKLWNALTDNEMIKDYWGRHRNVSDWKPGSRWEHQDYDNPKTIDVVGKVIESNPPSKLVLTWSFPQDEGNPDKVSRVTFQIEPFMEQTKLTVTHEDLEPDSWMLKGISTGWPLVLAALKTLIETGKPVDCMTRRWERPPE
jgi:uncharacterized protein YndB with AHSA1/START domain